MQQSAGVTPIVVIVTVTRIRLFLYLLATALSNVVKIWDETKCTKFLDAWLFSTHVLLRYISISSLYYFRAGKAERCKYDLIASRPSPQPWGDIRHLVFRLRYIKPMQWGDRVRRLGLDGDMARGEWPFTWSYHKKGFSLVLYTCRRCVGSEYRLQYIQQTRVMPDILPTQHRHLPPSEQTTCRNLSSKQQKRRKERWRKFRVSKRKGGGSTPQAELSWNRLDYRYAFGIPRNPQFDPIYVHLMGADDREFE